MTSSLHFEENHLLASLFGEYDRNLRYLESLSGVSISARGGHIHLAGESLQVCVVQKALKDLYKHLQANGKLNQQDINTSFRFAAYEAEKGGEFKPYSLALPTPQRRSVVARTPNQSHYMQKLLSSDMVFALGPAGTGKTYLAVAVGVSKLLSGEVDRLVLSRPAVEAGEKLGFLPGDLKDKVDPYLRPLYDALHYVLPSDMVSKKMQIGEIEIAPLAYMRGRTLSNAYIILDEGQNTTPVQMKMLLTRMGENSRMVVTGDLSQVDLPRGVRSGLRDALEIVEGIPDVVVIRFAEGDIVRHPLVAKIVHAYDLRDRKQRQGHDEDA